MHEPQHTLLQNNLAPLQLVAVHQSPTKVETLDHLQRSAAVRQAPVKVPTLGHQLLEWVAWGQRSLQAPPVFA